MQKYVYLIILLSLPIYCPGETSPHKFGSHSQVEGTCYLEVTSNGIVKYRNQVILDSIDPWNHFGLTLVGYIQSFEVQVMLNVFNYDEIGYIESDEVRLAITNEKASAHSLMTGSGLTQGEKLRVGLQVEEANLDCAVKMVQGKSGDVIAIKKIDLNKNDLKQIKDSL